MKFQIDISVWEKLKNSDEPIIMYGTGNGADKVMDKLTELGISLSGITASSTFVRNRTFRGFQVMPLSYFEEKTHRQRTFQRMPLALDFFRTLLRSQAYRGARRR